MFRRIVFLMSVCLTASAVAQIPKPDDAPQPVPPEVAAGQFKLPPGLRMELVASEPLIRESSGVCWDEQGRLFGPEHVEKAAHAETYGTVKYLIDRDGDGQAEVREVLYTGFSTGVLDRRMGDPQWGLDDWIYVGRSHRDATITGPHLKNPVRLPDTDFRIKPDGSAIEPISGATSGLTP